MKKKLLSFRIFDTLGKKYLTSESNVSIGLDGNLITSEGPAPEGRYQLAQSLPIFDVSEKQLFTDDGFVAIVGGKVVYGTPLFDMETCTWLGMADEVGAFRLGEFQILPNAEEIISGIAGQDIQQEWEKKAAAAPVPQGNTGGGTTAGYMRTRSYDFGCIKVLLTLQSETDMEENVWDEHFTSVLESEDIFPVKKQSEEIAEEPVQVQTVPVQFKATILKSQGSSRAPLDWWQLPEIVAAKPKQLNCEKSLQLVNGTDKVVAWEIGRGGTWSVASEFFLVEAITPLADESSNS